MTPPSFFGNLGFMLETTGRFFNHSPRDLKGRAMMIATALKHPGIVSRARTAPPGSPMAKTFAERPQMIGAFVWPFMSANWDAGERWARIFNHFETIARMGKAYSIGVDDRVALADFSDCTPGLSAVLDRPKGFMREGLLTINLFLGSDRIFSLSFSFFTEADGTITAFVGGIQGGKRDDILEIYRSLTKEMHGLRPRDFLFEMFRALCRHAGAARIHAVADGCRHHRHPYFRAEKAEGITNYDEAWADRGGVKVAGTHYIIEVTPERRDLSEVKANKRSMYRKRFEFLEVAEARIKAGLDGGEATKAAATPGDAFED